MDVKCPLMAFCMLRIDVCVCVCLCLCACECLCKAGVRGQKVSRPKLPLYFRRTVET